MRQLCRTIALVAGLLLSVAAPAAGQPDLKVAIVYNIIRFTRFVPPPPGGDVVLCVIGSPPLLDAFARIDGAAVPDGRLALRALARPSEVRGDCTIVYSQTTAASAHFDSAAMTIGEAPDFAGRGGTVGLRNFGRQVSFELNPDAGARRGVRFSARLLNLAAIVHAR